MNQWMYVCAIALLFTGCEGGDNAGKAGAVLDGREKGVITAPQEGTKIPTDTPDGQIPTLSPSETTTATGG